MTRKYSKKHSIARICRISVTFLHILTFPPHSHISSTFSRLPDGSYPVHTSFFV